MTLHSFFLKVLLKFFQLILEGERETLISVPLIYAFIG